MPRFSESVWTHEVHPVSMVLRIIRFCASNLERQEKGMRVWLTDIESICLTKKRENLGQANFRHTIPHRVTEDGVNNENSGFRWNWHHKHSI